MTWPGSRSTPQTAEGAQAGYDEVVAGMGERPRTVTVVDVAEPDSEGVAEATLRWSWDLGGDEPWAYEVTAPLTEGDGGVAGELGDRGWSSRASSPGRSSTSPP